MHRWYSCTSSEQCHVVASTSALHSELTVINKRYSYFKQLHRQRSLVMVAKCHLQWCYYQWFNVHSTYMAVYQPLGPLVAYHNISIIMHSILTLKWSSEVAV